MYWFLLAAIGMLAIAGLMMHSSLAALERRTLELEEESLRARVRLTNHQRQIDALGRELGWIDDRAHTKMLTGKVPKDGP